MTSYQWNKEKNLWFKEIRGISFEQIVIHIEGGDLLDIIRHPNNKKYAKQKVLIIRINYYIYTVTFVESGDNWFLKTIIPSKVFTKKYLGGK